VSTTSDFSSLAVEEGDDFENFNPNFLTKSNNSHSLLEENSSPKRSAAVEGGKKGRKKCKPTNHSFLQNNDFTALKDSNTNNNNNNNCGNSDYSRKVPAWASDSFSDLARNHGEVGAAWATSSTGSCSSNCNSNKEAMHRRRSSTADLSSPTSYSFHDETMDTTDTVSSPTMSMTSSTRKRGVFKSNFLDDESPVSRSRSRILSPPPVRTPDISCFMESIDSKRRAASKLMDVSFYSTKNSAKADRAMLDVTMSDDDVNVSGDSDISVDSEDEVMAMGSSNIFQARERPSPSMSVPIFEPGKATVNDIMKYMSSYEDIQFLSTSLQQNFEGQGGCLSWNIAPPVAWGAKRRDAFFQATRTLGFTFRAGGGNISYIQISKTRGSRLLSLLKATLATYNERKGRESSPNVEANNTPREFLFSSAVKKELQPASRVSKTLRLTPKE